MTDSDTVSRSEPRALDAEAHLLGDLLAIERVGAGIALEDMSARCGLSVEQTEDLESGDGGLTVLELSAALDGYFEALQLEPRKKTALDVDLDAGAISVTKSSWRASPEPADQNFLRYLQLVHRATGTSLDSPIPLHTVDLSLLRGALALRQTSVERHLNPEVIEEGSPRLVTAGYLAAALLILGGGIAIGLSRLNDAPEQTNDVPDQPATVTAAQVPATADPSAGGPISEPRIGTAVSITKEELEQQQAPITGPRILEPLVVERDPSSVPESGSAPADGE